MADLVNLAQVVLDVLLAEQRDVEPEVVAEARLHAFAFGDVLLHAARDDVARRQLLFLRLVVGHEAMAVDVLQQPAVAARAFGEQNAGGKMPASDETAPPPCCRARDAGLQRDRGGDAFQITALVVTR